MKQVIVRYRVKPEAAEENIRLVKAVYEELSQTRPSGLRYATFKAADGVTFFHIASIETEDGSNPLGQTKAFGEFQKGIKERCEEPPVPTDMEAVGSYGFFPDRDPRWGSRYLPRGEVTDRSEKQQLLEIL